jgi:electron transport complex protein RnfG
MTEKKLPVVESENPANGSNGDGPPPPVEADVSAFRLIGTLTLAGAVAGIAIVVAFKWANPKIQAYNAKVLAAAVTNVLGGATRYQTVYLDDGKLTPTPPDTAGLDRVYVGYDEAGKPTGIAMENAEPGFQDVIDLLFGYDPSTGDVIGMKVLTSNETPGLGARITSDSVFIKQFNDLLAPLVGVKEGQGKGKKDEVVMITGSTISSRAVIKIINDRIDAMKKPVDAYWSTLAGGVTTASGGAPSSGGSRTSAGGNKE